MKTFNNILMAAMAAAVLSSCTKVIEDNPITPVDEPQERIITLSFAGTRSTLDGLSVSFDVGDEIALSNGVDSVWVKVRKINGHAAIVTTLQGSLDAVYPAEFAEFNHEQPWYSVPSVQTGQFKHADICTATIDEDATSAEFTTQVSILRFYVDESIGVQSIKISGSDVATGSDVITVSPSGNNPTLGTSLGNRICYVAVAPNTYSTLTFSSITTSQDDYDDYTVERTISSVKLEESTIYNAFIPYYIGIDIDDDGTVDQKWGYCNIGAFLPEEYGRYFAFGDTEGQTWDGTSWSSDGFYVIPEVGDIDVLPLDYDAAYQNWGGLWHMPTKGEFERLLCDSNEYDYRNDCAIFYDTLVFPQAGSGYEVEIEYGVGLYWTSTVDGDNENNSFFLKFNNTLHWIRCDDDYDRSSGLSIRPIWGGASEPDDDTEITGGSLGPFDKIYF